VWQPKTALSGVASFDDYGYIAFDIGDEIAIEPDYQPAPFGLVAAPTAEVVHIVPAVVGKQIGDDGSPEQITYLIPRHANFYRDDIFGLELIALLDIDLVDTGCQEVAKCHH
jgi:hypothetical protein